MSTYAVNMAMAASNMASQTGTQQTGTSEVDFASLLSSALSSGTGGTAADTFTTLSSGIRWQDVQAGMMMDAMGLMQNNEGPASADPLMAQLMTMLKNLMNAGDVDSEGNMTDILALVQQMMERLRQLAEENGSQVAGQELLALMSGMGQSTPMNLADFMTSDALTDAAGTTMPYLDGTMVLNSVLDGTPEEMLSLLTGTSLQDIMAQARGAEEGTAQAAAMADPMAVVPGPNGGEEATQAEAQAGTAQGGQASGPAQFGGTIRQAWEALKPQADPPANAQDEELDIDALQQRVDAGVYLQNTAMAEAPMLETTGEVAAPPLANQLADGIHTAMRNGEEQFTIKLNPEDLGEVTIRLTKTAEGMTLDIIARSAETQRLLSGEAEALKESMRPLRVEVNSILTEQQDTLLTGQQQDMYGGHQRSWQQMHGAAYYGDEPLAQGSTAAATQVTARPTLSGMLDAYV